MRNYTLKNSSVSIIGLGLIGGSIAKVLKPYVKRLYAVDTDESVLSFAREQGVIDETPNKCDALEISDIVILCIYPEAAVDYVRRNAARFKNGSVVTDAVGVKTPLMALYKELKPKNFTYIGGHPMAGREVSGFINSLDGMFENASFIVTPPEDASEEQIALVEEMAKALRCRTVVRTTVENHDRIIAYTSQLPHVIATAMCDTPLLVRHKNFTGGSFEDVTRVARINENLWTELFLSNKKYLVEEIDRFAESIGRMRDAIAGNDDDALRAVMAKVRRDKELADKK